MELTRDWSEETGIKAVLMPMHILPLDNKTEEMTTVNKCGLSSYKCVCLCFTHVYLCVALSGLVILE